jgi:hypothetical protein
MINQESLVALLETYERMGITISIFLIIWEVYAILNNNIKHLFIACSLVLFFTNIASVLYGFYGVEQPINQFRDLLSLVVITATGLASLGMIWHRIHINRTVTTANTLESNK